jgi:hypothetical protein
MNSAVSAVHQLQWMSASRCSLNSTSNNKTSDKQEWDGVAVGLMLRRPKWWYKRYNVLIHNAMVNTPETWALQLFVNKEWFEGELLQYHRGLKRLVDSHHPRIVITPLPDDLKSLKPKGVLPNTWFWEHVVAERVLLFHGDGTLCSNTKKTWNDFVPYHYVGVPWGNFNGMGGSGTEFSLRSKSAMLAALQEHPYGGGPEDRYFVSTLMEMNKKAGREVYKIATPEVTQWFAGTDDIVGENNTLKEDETFGPLIVAGTQAHLTDDQRNWVLGTCPELKSIFPVLHNPHCFGAKPNLEECSYVITGVRPGQ